MAFNRKEYMRLYQQAHKAEHIAGNRRWRQQHPIWHQEYGWKKQGIVLTAAEREIILAKQNGCCAVCKRPESSFKKKLSADHDHKTGNVRGLLCATCNWRVVGLLENYKHLLPIAEKYLKSYSTNLR